MNVDPFSDALPLARLDAAVGVNYFAGGALVQRTAAGVVNTYAVSASTAQDENGVVTVTCSADLDPWHDESLGARYWLRTSAGVYVLCRAAGFGTAGAPYTYDFRLEGACSGIRGRPDDTAPTAKTPAYVASWDNTPPVGID